jgi:MFS family permease
VAIFALFIVVALTGGLVVNTITLALPKIVDDRVSNLSLATIGALTTAVVLCGALAQLAIGRLAEWLRPHVLFVMIALMQLLGILWVAYASGAALFVALAFTIAATYSQITVNDLVIARYTADAWRGRVYAVRYALTFMVSGVSASMIALMYARGGFDLVLQAMAAIAFAFFCRGRCDRADCPRCGRGGTAIGTRLIFAPIDSIESDWRSAQMIRRKQIWGACLAAEGQGSWGCIAQFLPLTCRRKPSGRDGIVIWGWSLRESKEPPLKKLPRMSGKWIFKNRRRPWHI